MLVSPARCGRGPVRFEPAAARRLSNRLRRFAAPLRGCVTVRLSRLAIGPAHRPRPPAQRDAGNRAPGHTEGRAPRPQGGSMSTTTQLRRRGCGSSRSSEIHIADGANPRRASTSRHSQELADSIGKHGVLQPLVVRTRRGRLHPDRWRAPLPGRQARRPHAGAGHAPRRRRGRADRTGRRREPAPPGPRPGRGGARLPGDPQLRPPDRRSSSPSGSASQPAYVNDRLRLLDLPEPIQEHVASGTIPVRLAKQLIEMAKAASRSRPPASSSSPTGDVKVDDLEERPERLIGCLGDYEWPDPQPIALARQQLPPLPARQPAAAGRRLRRHPRTRTPALGEQVGFRFDQEDADAARSYGCLLEFKRRPLLVERLHHRPGLHRRPRPPAARPARAQSQAARARGRQRAETRTRRRRRSTRRRSSGARSASSAAEAKQAATAANFELGRKLQLRYDAPKITTPVAKLLALLILDRRRGQARRARPALRARGLADRRADRGPRQDGREGPLPGGDEAAEQLYAAIERARSPEQVIGRLLQALIAAHAADEQALAASRARLLRAARPLRRRAKRRDPVDPRPARQVRPAPPPRRQAARQTSRTRPPRRPEPRPASAGASRSRPTHPLRTRTKEGSCNGVPAPTATRASGTRRLDELPDPPSEHALRARRPRRRSAAAHRPSPSSAHAPVPATAPRSRARSPATSPRPASPSSPASPAASTPKHTAAPSTRTGARSPCSAAASTATIPPRTPNSPAGSRETGGIVSEYEPGVEPAPWRFPARNRIIAALADAVVIVEARITQRRPHHRRPGDGDRPSDLRRPRRDHLPSLRGNERPPPTRPRHRNHLRARRTRSARNRRSLPMNTASHRHRLPE